LRSLIATAAAAASIGQQHGRLALFAGSHFNVNVTDSFDPFDINVTDSFDPNSTKPCTLSRPQQPGEQLKFHGRVPCVHQWRHSEGRAHIMGGYFGGDCTLPPAPPQVFLAGEFAGQARPIKFVHVGKSAGTSVKLMLLNAPINFTHVHLRNPGDSLDSTADASIFITVTRNPLRRTLSAFNFRHPRGGARPCQAINLSPLEKELYACFPDTSLYKGAANAFAEGTSALTRCGDVARNCLFDATRRCEHLGQNHAFYLATAFNLTTHSTPPSPYELAEAPSVLSLCRNRSAHACFVIRTENFKADLQYLFRALGLPPVNRTIHANSHYARQHDTVLSHSGESALKSALLQEYQMVSNVNSIMRHAPDDDDDSLYRKAWEMFSDGTEPALDEGSYYDPYYDSVGA